VLTNRFLATGPVNDRRRRPGEREHDTHAARRTGCSGSLSPPPIDGFTSSTNCR
jgi:hypothetical protein